MLESVRDAVRRRFLVFLVKYKAWRSTSEEVSYSEYWHTVKRCVLVWPQSSMDKPTLYTLLDQLNARFSGLKTTIISFPGNTEAVFFANTDMVSLSHDSVKWLGYLNSDISKRLSLLEFDLLIDLSPEFDPFSAYICQLPRAVVKVGFAKPYGDLVLNYQIATKLTTDHKQRYNVLLHYIG